MKKIKTQQISIIIATCISILSSCTNDDICGPIKSSSNKIEFHICENILNNDTLDSDWFAKLPEEYSSDYWLGNYDTIAFHLPNGFQIIEASQSFLIMPSIWAKSEDEVVQYVEFHDLKMHCKNPKDLKINNNNMLINGFDIDEKLSTELYFRNKKHINKNELLMSLQKQYDANAREINKMKIDENITALDKKKLLTDIQREKNIYSGYLKNYTNWETASRHQLFSKDGSELPGEQFELLAVKRYLTVTIKCGDKLDKITIVYTPTYGN